MRAFLIATAVIGLGGCEAVPPYMDLREPIYMVTDSSFWIGCEDDGAGYEACRTLRVQQVENGVNEWFKHFDEATRPQVVIVYSKADLPSNRGNDPIYIKIKPGYCPVATSTPNAAACYSYQSSTMIFDSSENITPRTSAHEFGHALGRGDNDVPENVYSVMSSTHDSEQVVPIDIKIMCKMHPECPPHEDAL